MKNNFSIILIFIPLLLLSCDDVSVVNPQLTTKQYIVVRSELKAWTNFDGVSFTKTLPIEEAYDTNKAYLKNVIAYLKINDILIIPLHYQQGGVYKPYGNVFLKSGDKVELYADASGTSIYGKTKIPNQPTVTSSSYSSKHIDVSIKSNPDEVYGAVWVIINPSTNSLIDMGTDFLEIINSSYDKSLPTTSVRTMDMPDQYISDGYKDYRFVRAYAFDQSYLKYFNTRKNNQPVSNAFVQGGDQIVWNVQGNNVIGLFIGSSSSSYVKTN
jgi:hypothetical protein